MKIAVITIFPEMFTALTDSGVIGRAIQQGIVELAFYNPRDYSVNKHKTVDDRPYGGGPGMVMTAAPLLAAIRAAKVDLDAALNQTKTVYMSPQGHTFGQAVAIEQAKVNSLILVCGRYEGIDERIIKLEVDAEWSVGDYVLSGGEIPAMTVIDAITRLLPGALGHELSAKQDSYSDGLLDCPHYTRPESFEELEVPAVLLSGDHDAIRVWRLKQALGRTLQRRSDLLVNRKLTEEETKLLYELQNPDSLDLN